MQGDNGQTVVSRTLVNDSNDHWLPLDQSMLVYFRQYLPQLFLSSELRDKLAELSFLSCIPELLSFELFGVSFD